MYRLLVALLISTFPILLSAQSVFDQLVVEDAHDRVKATLFLPVDSIYRRTNDDVKADFSFVDNVGTLRHYDIKVSARGKFRRSRCEMPPMKFDFSKKDLERAGLARHDKYKLVIPCFDNPLGEELLLKEFLAYQAYQLVSPYSYRTQLLELTLRDENGAHDERTTLAFLIEDTDEMAARCGGVEEEDIRGLQPSVYDAEAEVTHALFQYLVANGDWSLLLNRNVKMLRLPNGKIVPVGYDFDFTGWVGAPYATGVMDVGQESVYHRVYLGYAQNDATITRVINKFKGQRKAILKLIDRSALSEETRMVTYRFATRFFSKLNRAAGTDETTIYDQLRGETADVIPSGESEDHFRSLLK